MIAHSVTGNDPDQRSSRHNIKAGMKRRDSLVRYKLYKYIMSSRGLIVSVKL